MRDGIERCRPFSFPIHTFMGITQVYKGLGTSTPLFKKYESTFFDQSSTGKALCNVRKNQVFLGTSTAKTLLTVVDGKIFSGSGTSNCLFTIKDGVVFKGTGTSTPVYRISKRALYQGSGTSKMVINWTGSQLTEVDIAAAVWLLQYAFAD